MSHQAVQVVLEKTLADDGFRSRLFAEPDVTLEGYDLTDEESAALRSMCLDLDVGESRELDQRRSKRPLWTAGL